MKKFLLAVLAISVFGITSCKKEESAQPQVEHSAAKVAKKDVATWD